jgi:hypothetical protein
VASAESVLDYLWSIAPDGATNGEIARRLAISSHQVAFMVTRDLFRRGLIRAERTGRTWMFYALEKQPILPARRATLASDTSSSGGVLLPAAFEGLARRLLGERYATILPPGRVPGVRKLFDFVSPDGRIVGDAKYYTRVGGIRLPPAKFSVIAEHVWLLEKTHAPGTFLVFGNDRRVPVLWLERYGNLVSSVVFYFLTDDGQLETLTRGDEPARRT